MVFCLFLRSCAVPLIPHQENRRGENTTWQEERLWRLTDFNTSFFKYIVKHGLLNVHLWIRVKDTIVATKIITCFVRIKLSQDKKRQFFIDYLLVEIYRKDADIDKTIRLLVVNKFWVLIKFGWITLRQKDRFLAWIAWRKIEKIASSEMTRSDVE